MSTHYEQRKAANERYLSKMDEVRIRMPKESGLKDAIQAHAETRGESVQAFILRAIQETMTREQVKQYSDVGELIQDVLALTDKKEG